MDEIVIQKAACPVLGGSTVEGAGERLRDEKPNGVVGEKSSYDDADINAQRIAALRHLCAELGADVLNSEANHAQLDRHQEDQGTSDGTLSGEELAQLPASQRKRARREPRQFVAEAAQDDEDPFNCPAKPHVDVIEVSVTSYLSCCASLFFRGGGMALQ